MEDCVVKLRLRDNEGINDAVKRFRKLVEHAGIKKEMRRREFYEKPSETRRRARRRAERRSRIQRMVGGGSIAGAVSIPTQIRQNANSFVPKRCRSLVLTFDASARRNSTEKSLHFLQMRAFFVAPVRRAVMSGRIPKSQLRFSGNATYRQ